MEYSALASTKDRCWLRGIVDDTCLPKNKNPNVQPVRCLVLVPVVLSVFSNHITHSGQPSVRSVAF